LYYGKLKSSGIPIYQFSPVECGKEIIQFKTEDNGGMKVKKKAK
jgi:hypothetical protein